MNNFKQTAVIVACLFALAAAAAQIAAQCESAPSIVSVRVDPNDNEIHIGLNYEINWHTTNAAMVPLIQNKDKWSIVSPSLLARARAAEDAVAKASLYDQASPGIRSVIVDGNRGVIITTDTALLDTEKYMVHLADDNGVIPAKCLPAATAVKVNTQNKPPTGSPPSDDKKTVLAPVEKRDDAEIYVEGLVEGASGKDVTFTLDASAKKKFAFREEDPETYWAPFFNFKGSTKEDADPDSVSFGVEFENPLSVGSNPFDIKRLYFRETAKFEADRDFENVNLIGDFGLRLVSRQLNRNRFNIVPFVGIEVGKNLKHIFPEAKGQGIARPFVGATFYSRLYTFESNKFEKAIAFEALWERRWPLTDEIAIQEDDEGNPIAVPVRGFPRDYVKSSLIFDFAKNFGFKANYEYGSVPPIFKHVDHKFSLGLVFKGAFKRQ